MHATTTHLKTMNPKLDTMSCQKYGKIQLAGGNTKQAQIRSSPWDAGMLKVSKKDTVPSGQVTVQSSAKAKTPDR